jgi:hypothetical protein
METPRKTRMRRLLAVLIVLSASATCFQISNTAHWSRCQKIADEHALMVKEISRYIQDGAKVVPTYDDGPPADARELLGYRSRLRWKYRLAAWCPWKDVPPDPPIPLLTAPRKPE